MSGMEIAVTLGGIVVVALLAWFFFGPKEARQAEVKGGVQEIHITVKGGYSPALIRVQQGVPLRLTFDRQEASDCTSRVVFPDFQVSKSLPAFAKTTVEFVPNKSGEFSFACGMNMIHGTLMVEAGGNRPEAMPATQPAGPATVTTTNGQNHETAKAVGVGPTREVGKTLRTEFALLGGGVTCPTCVANIESAFQLLPGVDELWLGTGDRGVRLGTGHHS